MYIISGFIASTFVFTRMSIFVLICKCVAKLGLIIITLKTVLWIMFCILELKKEMWKYTKMHDFEEWPTTALCCQWACFYQREMHFKSSRNNPKNRGPSPSLDLTIADWSRIIKAIILTSISICNHLFSDFSNWAF